jgi:hypothetical protein
MPRSQPSPTRLLPLATVVALFLLCAPAAGAHQQVRRVGRGRTTHGIVVRALASGGFQPLPLRGARVKVLSGRRVVARGRVGALGMGLVGNFRRTPRDLEVIVSGGRIGHRRFAGSLVADVRDYRSPRTVHVDFVTTLAARFETAHPTFSPRRVQRTVRRFLGLPGSYVIGLDGRTDVAFDGRRFLAVAGAGHRDERFVTKLVKQMRNPRARRSFAAPSDQRPHHPHKAAAHQGAARALDGAGSAGTRLLDLDAGGADGLDGVTSAISSGSGLFGVLDKGATLLEFVNTGLAIDGVIEEAQTREQIEALGEELQEVEQSLAVVQQTVDQIQRENEESAYSDLAAQAEETQAAVQSAEDTLQSAAALSIQEGSIPPERGEGSRCDEIAGMLTGRNGFVANMEATGLDTPGKVNAYAERIAGDALAQSPPEARGLIQDASALAFGSPGQIFFDAAASEGLRSAAAYWISSYTEALSLVATYWGLDGANEATLENDVEQVENVAEGMPAAVPDALEGEAVDVRNGMMVATDALGSGTLDPSYEELSAGTWHFESATRQWASSNGLTLRPITFVESLPFSNWQIAGIEQIHTLQSQVGGKNPGEGIMAQSGMIAHAFNPPYYADGFEFQGQGLEYEYMFANGVNEGPGPGCIRGPGTCVWPVWVGNGVITDFLHSRRSYGYVHGYFEVGDPLNVEWYGYPLWGFDNSATIYGGDPIGDIPFLFYRQVGPSECYYYPVGVPAAGSPGCRT